MSRMLKCLFALILCASIAWGASVPADWASGVNYTYQTWSFATSANPSPADTGYINPGVPMFMMNTSAAAWFPTWQAFQGAWVISGPASSVPTNPMVMFTIPNVPDPTRTKYLWVDIVFQANDDFIDDFYMAVLDNNYKQFALEGAPSVIPIDPTYGYYQIAAIFSIFPQPESETILLGLYSINAEKFLAVDSITVATVCPEPATMGILALGSLLAFRKR